MRVGIIIMLLAETAIALPTWFSWENIKVMMPWSITAIAVTSYYLKTKSIKEARFEGESNLLIYLKTRNFKIGRNKDQQIVVEFSFGTYNVDLNRLCCTVGKMPVGASMEVRSTDDSPTSFATYNDLEKRKTTISSNLFTRMQGKPHEIYLKHGANQGLGRFNEKIDIPNWFEKAMLN